MAIRGKVTVKQDDSVAQILEILKGRRSFAQIRDALLQGVAHGNDQMRTALLKERIVGQQGPFPVPMKRLGRKTGELRKRLRFSRPSFQQGVLRTSVGTNLKYFGRHEFGGSGKQVRVKAHRVKAHKRNNLFGRQQRVEIPEHTRQAYLRKDTMPKREPVQAGLREHATRIYGITLEKALVRALEGGIA